MNNKLPRQRQTQVKLMPRCFCLAPLCNKIAAQRGRAEVNLNSEAPRSTLLKLDDSRPQIHVALLGAALEQLSPLLPPDDAANPRGRPAPAVACEVQGPHRFSGKFEAALRPPSLFVERPSLHSSDVAAHCSHAYQTQLPKIEHDLFDIVPKPDSLSPTSSSLT